MAILEIKADLSRTAAALERIADALERAYPDLRYQIKDKGEPTGELITVTDEELLRWEEEEKSQNDPDLNPTE